MQGKTTRQTTNVLRSSASFVGHFVAESNQDFWEIAATATAAAVVYISILGLLNSSVHFISTHINH